MNHSVMTLANAPKESRMAIPEIIKQASLMLPGQTVLGILFFLFAHMDEIISIGTTIEQAVIDLVAKYREVHPVQE